MLLEKLTGSRSGPGLLGAGLKQGESRVRLLLLQLVVVSPLWAEVHWEREREEEEGFVFKFCLFVCLLAFRSGLLRKLCLFSLSGELLWWWWTCFLFLGWQSLLLPNKSLNSLSTLSFSLSCFYFMLIMLAVREEMLAPELWDRDRQASKQSDICIHRLKGRWTEKKTKVLESIDRVGDTFLLKIDDD